MNRDRFRGSTSPRPAEWHLLHRGSVAQWIRARASEARSRGFDSLLAQDDFSNGYNWRRKALPHRGEEEEFEKTFFLFRCGIIEDDRREKKGVSIMAAAYLPSILVPLVGLVFPAIAMASLFLYIEKEEIV